MITVKLTSNKIRSTTIFCELKKTNLIPVTCNRQLSVTTNKRMSDCDEDNSAPDGETAQKLVKEFEHVTNTDEIMAQMFLQDNSWNLSQALNSFFNKKCEKIEQEKAEELAARLEAEEEEDEVEQVRKVVVQVTYMKYSFGIGKFYTFNRKHL